MRIKNYLLYMAIMATACLCLYFVGNIVQRASPANAVASRQTTVIVDAGHGGEDGGASGADGTLEKTLNLEVALKVRDMLRMMGYRVIMTRETDISIHDSNAKNTRQRKRTDLANRAELLKRNPAAVYIGIHMNLFTQTQYSGTQVFFSAKSPESKPLAESIQSAVKTMLQSENNRVVKQATSDIFLLHTAENVAVMVECGFLSNAAELEKLKTDEYQCQMAFAIVSGLISSF